MEMDEDWVGLDGTRCAGVDVTEKACQLIRGPSCLSHRGNSC
jgi:hypothetical protein